ncbi:hypothetical protein SPRG_04985, partial [Saprolegnia parasitica CBS 223.65]
MRIYHPLTLAALCVVLHESLGAQHANALAHPEHRNVAQPISSMKRHLRGDRRHLDHNVAADEIRIPDEALIGATSDDAVGADNNNEIDGNDAFDSK